MPNAGFVIALPMLLLGGCAGFEFTNGQAQDAFLYHNAAPFALVRVAKDCAATVEVVVLPGTQHGVRMKNGLGTAKLNIKLTNDMVTEIGQETDSKIPETVTALAAAAESVASPGPSFAGRSDSCTPTATLYQIRADASGTVTFDRANALALIADENRRAARR